MWLLLLLFLFIYIISRPKTEHFNSVIEKLPYTRENNLQISDFKSSQVKEINFDLDIDLNDGKEIREIYDNLVDDGRVAAQKYESLDTIDEKEYYAFTQKQNYGTSNFPSY